MRTRRAGPARQRTGGHIASTWCPALAGPFGDHLPTVRIGDHELVHWRRRVLVAFGGRLTNTAQLDPLLSPPRNISRPISTRAFRIGLAQLLGIERQLQHPCLVEALIELIQ